MANNLWYNHIEKGGEAMAKSRTSTEVSERYKRKTYKYIPIRLRYDSDQRLLSFLEDYKEKIGTSQIFREALEDYINKNYPDYK